MKRSMAALCALALITAALIPPVLASEGELEWESVPRAGVITVTYKEGMDPDTGLLHQNLKVRILAGEPVTPLLVVIKGKRVGTITTDTEGNGLLEIDKRGTPPGEDGRPPVRRRIDEGDVCEILSGERRVADTFILVPPPPPPAT